MRSLNFETNTRSTGIKPKHKRKKTAVDRLDRNLSKGKIQMSKILRNAVLAVVAVAGLSGSAYAQQVINSCSNHDYYWTQCLGAANGGHNSDHGSDRR